MNICGTVLTLKKSNETDLWECNFGLYENEVEMLLPVKFWSSAIKEHSVLFIAGLVQRNNKTREIWVDCKHFSVFASPVDGMILTSFLHIHGKVEKDNVIASSNWHGQDLGVCGDFETKFQKRPNDPRPPASVGTETLLNGKVIGFNSENFIVEVMNFEHCPRKITEQSTPKKIKLGMTLPSTPQATPKLVLKQLKQ